MRTDTKCPFGLGYRCTATGGLERDPNADFVIPMDLLARPQYYLGENMTLMLAPPRYYVVRMKTFTWFCMAHEVAMKAYMVALVNGEEVETFGTRDAKRIKHYLESGEALFENDRDLEPMD